MKLVKYNLDILDAELEEAIRFAEVRGFQGLANTIRVAKDQLKELKDYRATELSPEQIDDWARKVCDIRSALGFATMEECRTGLCGGNAGKVESG